MSLEDEALLGSSAGILFAPARSYAWNLVSTRLTQFLTSTSCSALRSGVALSGRESASSASLNGNTAAC